MGYILSNIMQAPLDPQMRFYVWLIGTGWDGGLEEKVRQNFHRLASRFGPEGAFIMPAEAMQESWGDKVTEAYFPNEEPRLFVPCLFLTDAHPSDVPQDALRAFIPLEHVDTHFGSFDALFDDLVRLIQNRDVSLFNKMEEQMRWLEHHDVLELKPNLFGFGLNINTIISKIQRNASEPNLLSRLFRRRKTEGA